VFAAAVNRFAKYCDARRYYPDLTADEMTLLNRCEAGNTGNLPWDVQQALKKEGFDIGSCVLASCRG
jgi:hypothetical protein